MSSFYIKENIINNKFLANLKNSLNTMTIYDICDYMKDKLNSHSEIKLINNPTINDFDSLIVDNPPQIDCYYFKSCMEAIDQFINDMNTDC